MERLGIIFVINAILHLVIVGIYVFKGISVIRQIALSHTMSKYKDTCTAMFLSPRAKSFIAHWHSYGRRNAGSAIIRFQGSSRMAAHGACVC